MFGPNSPNTKPGSTVSSECCRIPASVPRPTGGPSWPGHGDGGLPMVFSVGRLPQNGGKLATGIAGQKKRVFLYRHNPLLYKGLWVSSHDARREWKMLCRAATTAAGCGAQDRVNVLPRTFALKSARRVL